jgi:hypothetical protein
MLNGRSSTVSAMSVDSFRANSGFLKSFSKFKFHTRSLRSLKSRRTQSISFVA